MGDFRTSELRLVTDGLGYPEGPVYQSDGSVLLVEIKNGNLTRVTPDGSKQVVASLGGGPNGAAIGPDKAVYVCNDGGLVWEQIPSTPKTLAVCFPTFQPANYTGGSIQRVSGNTFTTLYSQCNDSPLRSPDDLVFDVNGNFWFTDWGKLRPTDRDITAVYYAQSDGQKIVQAIPQRSAPNGIALSPDDKRLYVAETYSRWIVYWELESAGSGVIIPNKTTIDHSYLLTADIPGCGTLDRWRSTKKATCTLQPCCRRVSTPRCRVASR